MKMASNAHTCKLQADKLDTMIVELTNKLAELTDKRDQLREMGNRQPTDAECVPLLEWADGVFRSERAKLIL
jgi:hypothetical protein